MPLGYLIDLPTDDPEETYRSEKESKHDRQSPVHMLILHFFEIADSSIYHNLTQKKIRVKLTFVFNFRSFKNFITLQTYECPNH